MDDFDVLTDFDPSLGGSNCLNLDEIKLYAKANEYEFVFTECDWGVPNIGGNYINHIQLTKGDHHIDFRKIVGHACGDIWEVVKLKL